MSQSLFYWITYSYNCLQRPEVEPSVVSILILLDYLFLLAELLINTQRELCCLNPYFIGLPILIMKIQRKIKELLKCLNPYFIGLPILIFDLKGREVDAFGKSQSLFYWITYSYMMRKTSNCTVETRVSILILLDYLFLL